MDLPLTGGCLCGGVRWELGEPPLGAHYCHCKRCQRRSGSAASASARVNPDAFRIVSGEELVRAYQPEDGWAKHFCSTCGSSVYSRAPDGSQMGVRMGGFDVDPGVRPDAHIHVATAAVWEPLPDDGLPRHERGFD